VVKPLDESTYKDGLKGKGRKWEERASAASTRWFDEAYPYFDAARKCSDEVRGMAGYGKLTAYAECMARAKGK